MVPQGLSRLGRSAQVYAEQGLATIPCKPLGKAPLVPSGVNEATSDPRVLAGWWRRWPDANVAIAVPAWAVVVDIDGEAGHAAIEERALTLPRTVTAITGRGAPHSHLWYRLPEGVAVKNAVAVLPGVDVRAKGGYVVAPPSVTTSAYRWLGEVVAPTPDGCAQAPAWLIERCTQPRHRIASPRGEWRELVGRGVAEGQRNSAVARLAGHLLRRNVDAVTTLELLMAWNEARCRPPLARAEIFATVESIARRELVRREGRR